MNGLTWRNKRFAILFIPNLWYVLVYPYTVYVLTLRLGLLVNSTFHWTCAYASPELYLGRFSLSPTPSRIWSSSGLWGYRTQIERRQNVVFHRFPWVFICIFLRAKIVFLTTIWFIWLPSISASVDCWRLYDVCRAQIPNHEQISDQSTNDNRSTGPDL